MKKVWRMLLLAGVFTVLLCVSALAAGEGICDVTVTGENVTMQALDKDDKPVTPVSTVISESKTIQHCAGTEKVKLTYNGGTSDKYYLVMLLDSTVVPTVSDIKAGDIAYINQDSANGSGSVSFTVYPNKLENGKTYNVYLASNDGTLNTLTKQGSFSYYVPYTLGDASGDGKVNVIDAGLVLSHVAEKTTLEGNKFLAADVSAPKGIVNVLDAAKILSFVAQKIDSLD